MTDPVMMVSWWKARPTVTFSVQSIATVP